MQQVKAYIAHKSQGRLRLRIPEYRNKTDYFATWQESIEQWPQTQLVETNPLTASLLIHHDGDDDSLLEQTKQLGFELLTKQSAATDVKALDSTLTNQQDTNITAGTPLWKPITDQLVLTNKKLSQLTGGSIDLPSLLFVALLLQGLIQFIKKPAPIMPWETALWFALNVYMMVKKQGE